MSMMTGSRSAAQPRFRGKSGQSDQSRPRLYRQLIIMVCDDRWRPAGSAHRKLSTQQNLGIKAATLVVTITALHRECRRHHDR
jgi:hypothetical protein